MTLKYKYILDEKEVPLEDCKDSHLYEVQARNSGIGVFVNKYNGFVIPRRKFDKLFLFIEYHWDTGMPHGTAKCYRELEAAPEKFPWDDCYAKSNQNKEKDMLDYLLKKEAEYDINFKSKLRYCLRLDRSAQKKDKPINKDIILSWANNSIDTQKRIIRYLEQYREEGSSLNEKEIF